MKKLKRSTKGKLIASAVVMIFLALVFYRAQRVGVAINPPVYFYETKTTEGATFNSIFSKDKVTVVREDSSGVVTIIQDTKTYRYIVADNSGSVAVKFTDLQSGSLEPVTYPYDHKTYQLKDKQTTWDEMMREGSWPEDYSREDIIRFGLLNTRAVWEEDTGLFGAIVLVFLFGFLMILFCKQVAIIDCYIANIFYKLENPKEPRKWTIVAVAVFGIIIMIWSGYGLLGYLL